MAVLSAVTIAQTWGDEKRGDELDGDPVSKVSVNVRMKYKCYLHETGPRSYPKK